MKLDVQLIKDLYDTLAFDEAPSGDDKTDADVYRKHHNKLIQSLSRLEHLEKRLAILEPAVAFRGFDELPERKLNRFGRSDVHIDLIDVDGTVYYNHLHESLVSEYIEHGYTGWRYPVGDLSE